MTNARSDGDSAQVRCEHAASSHAAEPREQGDEQRLAFMRRRRPSKLVRQQQQPRYIPNEDFFERENLARKR